MGARKAKPATRKAEPLVRILVPTVDERELLLRSDLALGRRVLAVTKPEGQASDVAPAEGQPPSGQASGGETKIAGLTKRQIKAIQEEITSLITGFKPVATKPEANQMAINAVEVEIAFSLEGKTGQVLNLFIGGKAGANIRAKISWKRNDASSSE